MSDSKQTFSHRTAVMLAIFGAVLMLGLPLALRIFVIEAFRLPSGGMFPTYQVGDHIFARKMGVLPPRRGDIIVFRYPKEPDKIFIKRVIAIGGDTIEVRCRDVWINGQALPRRQVAGDCQIVDGEAGPLPCERFEETNHDQRYQVVNTPGDRCTTGTVAFPYQVPPRQAFVMGDNRDNSYDSRFWGAVPYDAIIGKPWFIWWSEARATR